MHCPFTGINIPRFIIATLAGFIFVFGLDYIVHQNLLTDLYDITSSFWRAPESMQSIFPYIFTRNFEGKGIKEGIRFGMPFGLLFALFMGSSYLWMPIPLELALSWAISGLATGFGLGIIFSLTYRK